MQPSPSTAASPTALDTALTFIPLFSGTLSILGASAILYNVLSDPQRRFTTPYFRIMFGLSVADIPFAVSRMFSTFAAPKGSPGLYYASGNKATCNAQGFVVHMGLSQALYTACLCINYLLVIKYSKSDAFLSKYLEPYMHILSIGYPLVGSILSVSWGLYSSNPRVCGYNIRPPRCIHTNTVLSCSDKTYRSYTFLWIFIGSPLAVSFVIVVGCLTAIVWTVWNRERVMNRRFSFGNHTVAQSTHLIKQTQAVKRQACLHFISFVLVWGFTSAHRILMKRSIQLSSLLVLAQFFCPLQGFFHFLIYVWPRYIKSKDENPDKTFGWLFQDAVITTTRVKQQRRQAMALQKHYERRRSSMNAMKLNLTVSSISGLGAQNMSLGEVQKDVAQGVFEEDVCPDVPLEILNEDPVQEEENGRWNDDENVDDQVHEEEDGIWKDDENVDPVTNIYSIGEKMIKSTSSVEALVNMSKDSRV